VKNHGPLADFRSKRHRLPRDGASPLLLHLRHRLIRQKAWRTGPPQAETPRLILGSKLRSGWMGVLRSFPRSPWERKRQALRAQTIFSPTTTSFRRESGWADLADTPCQFPDPHARSKSVRACLPRCVHAFCIPRFLWRNSGGPRHPRQRGNREFRSHSSVILREPCLPQAGKRLEPEAHEPLAQKNLPQSLTFF